MPSAIAFLVAHGIPSATLAQAARIAADTGVPADEALIRSGLAREEDVYHALAAEIGLPFRTGDLPIHAMARFPEACLAGLAPLAPEDEAGALSYAYAPCGADFHDLVVRRRPASCRLVVVTPTNLRREVMRARAVPIAARAADGLPRAHPALSARESLSVPQCLAGLGSALVLGLSAMLWPTATRLYVMAACSLAFLAVTTLRLASVGEPIAPHAPPDLPRSRDRDLPVYTILVPLAREARILRRLVAGLAALDYPYVKLDVKLLVELDDAETRAAIEAADLPAWIETVLIPPGSPRTKPRALNVALPLARGEFVTVFDAEDVPDPAQLRLAVALMRRLPNDVACLQARLVIDNTGDGLITRLFTLEYGALFDVLNPALSRFDLPIPLGGTSNHFRTAILQALGGWDAWNVTEDADLGIRLAAAGYRVADLPSATFEEAPATLAAWIRQRRRWMKGFLQVSITHSRRPARLFAQLGTMRFCGAVAMSAGTVGSALGFPVFLAWTVLDLAGGGLLAAREPAEIACASIAVTLVVTGLLAMILPPLEGARRRRLWRLVPYVVLMPLYYVLVSWAAWRGLVDLVAAPHVWHKTEHGLARTSRAGGSAIDPDRRTRTSTDA